MSLLFQSTMKSSQTLLNDPHLIQKIRTLNVLNISSFFISLPDFQSLTRAHLSNKLYTCVKWCFRLSPLVAHVPTSFHINSFTFIRAVKFFPCEYALYEFRIYFNLSFVFIYNHRPESKTRRDRLKSEPYLRLKNIQRTTIGNIWKNYFFKKIF